jgi:hypothetical protein
MQQLTITLVQKPSENEHDALISLHLRAAQVSIEIDRHIPLHPDPDIDQAIDLLIEAHESCMFEEAIDKLMEAYYGITG